MEQPAHPPPYSVEMDPDKAREFVQKGATLLLLDVPPGTAVSIDHQMFLSGPKFQGVKMLPPGAHMLCYYAVGSEPAAFSAPTIRWLVLRPKQVVVLRWQPDMEMLAELQDADEEERYALGVRNFDFDGGLAPYFLPGFQPWTEMAGAISQQTLHRLLPDCLNVSVTAEAPPSGAKSEELLEEHLGRAAKPPDRAARGPSAAESVPSASSCGHEASSHSDAQAEDAVKARGQTGRCRYSPLPLRVHMADLTAAELTAANMDKSAVLANLIATRLGGSHQELLAEFQMSFLNFVMGHSLEGYSQWKDFLHLMCSCSSAATGPLAGFVVSFARTLRHQLTVTLESTAGTPRPEGMAPAAPFGVTMVEELLAASFLKPVLGNWMEDLEDAGGAVDPELLREAQLIRSLLSRRLGIHLGLTALGEEDEDDEYAPVVVDL
mmetsp:Transcript_39536/g.112109  ORF Transcript_39536/g.112109 Transcript_39536/m.112109 type:complete len:435 (-) Transcript_39536:116-1420(-)|eukprot:CAMPEP_0117669644 /NCGR_PEP_ID=MMETSP0804-20121206/12255_1 /TAXON_ID=1074897 /ORGANISM="Tetraselmis astigmatica, Strain CCMP880" /LENGTH=434 /DNA_ID=CAMNT_0005477741 /DNA_START=291 /DNA_END=1595 /DNA_ORIENTATION=-